MEVKPVGVLKGTCKTGTQPVRLVPSIRETAGLRGIVSRIVPFARWEDRLRHEKNWKDRVWEETGGGSGTLRPFL